MVAVDEPMLPRPVKLQSLGASAVEVERKSVESRPSSLSAWKAAGTAPSVLRGVISSSASMVTPKYKVWLKLTVESEVMEPSITEKRPLVTVTSLPAVWLSVQMAVPPVAAV